MERSISPDRLSTYVSEAAGDKERALKLYVWNSEISSAFYTPLQSLEVTLRNALHRELQIFYGTQAWYDRAPLDQYGQNNIQKAKATVRRLHQHVNPPHVVAELSFGFWLTLLNKRYHQILWIPALNRAFPGSNKNRANILSNLDHLRIFRNRIAHHEPVFKRHLKQDFVSIIKAVGWICADTASWTEFHSNVDDVIARKPL